VTPLEQHLRKQRNGGRKLLVPYLTGGLTADWLDHARALEAAGADALEVGIPFSDPVMDGPTIQAASAQALARGATPRSVLADLRTADLGIPVVVMTYYNLVFRAGHERMAGELADAGVKGAIVADLNLEESSDWEAATAETGVANILLAAPVTPDDRLDELCRRSQGYVYGVGLMGVTGERGDLATSLETLAVRLKKATDKPVLMGFGISDADQAVEASRQADGVIVGSAYLRRILHGLSPPKAASLIAKMRTALDS
jgi:tryptophan synthase alpha chain